MDLARSRAVKPALRQCDLPDAAAERSRVERLAVAGELGPGGAEIGRLPEAAGVRSDVDRVRLRLGGSDPGDRRVLVRVERTEIVLLRRYRPGQCIAGRADLREGRAPVGRAIED